MARANYCKHFARAIHAGVELAQLGRHVAITFGNHGLVQLRRLRRELAEARLEHVALLELFDFVFLDLLVNEQAGGKA